jgi:hypothetical protein
MQLQLALDHPAALAFVACVAPEVDLIEAGTPLLKRFGLSVLASLRELAPGRSSWPMRRSPTAAPVRRGCSTGRERTS